MEASDRGRQVTRRGKPRPQGERATPLRTRSGGVPGSVWALIGAGAALAAASGAAAVSSGLAGYFARRVVIPERVKTEDQEILALQRLDGVQAVILKADGENTVDGEYSLFFAGGAGHARIGRVLEWTPGEETVTREVVEVYSGDLATAVRGRWSGAVYDSPAQLGYDWQELELELEVGAAPAWLIPAERPARRWAVMVHGRGASRQEGLRAVRTARAHGLSSLLISYRNDSEAPPPPDGRYGLGMTEWKDVEVAIRYAVDHGAEEVVLFGWSMGGAICLTTADRSELRQQIRALVLDAPVVDWVDVLAHQARVNRIPSAIGRLGQLFLGNPWGRRITGLAAPLDFKAMDWVSRAVELRTPTLIVHSVDDDFVPSGPSAELAQRNAEMVTFESFRKARHTKEWNVDRERWEYVVGSWLRDELVPRPGPRSAALSEAASAVTRSEDA